MFAKYKRRHEGNVVPVETANDQEAGMAAERNNKKRAYNVKFICLMFLLLLLCLCYALDTMICLLLLGLNAVDGSLEN